MTGEELKKLVNHIWNPACAHKAKSRMLSWTVVGKNPDGTDVKVCPVFNIAMRRLAYHDAETVREAMYAEIEQARFPSILNVADRCAEATSRSTDEAPEHHYRTDISHICKVVFAHSDRSEYACHVCESSPDRLSDPQWYRTAIMHLEHRDCGKYRAGGVPYDFAKLIPLYRLAATRWEEMLAEPKRYAKDCLRAARWICGRAPSEAEGELVRVLSEDLGVEPQALLVGGREGGLVLDLGDVDRRGEGENHA